FAKEKLMNEALPSRYRFIFYHDAVYRLVQWDEGGKEITESVERTRSLT
ncbi:MAG TPA: MBL fold metallo-hydrolase, partial [Sporosarcina sp.]|nr:MBL fold metallo-hydrolase [Sporosarcina sp.]